MPPTWLLAAFVVAQQTTTTEVKRVVGEPLDPWIVWAAGGAVLAVILVAGFVARRHMGRAERATPSA